MEEIKLKKITPQTLELFLHDDSLGFINEYEYLDLRVQIQKLKVSGYRIKFEDKFVDILTNGKISIYPKGFFDFSMNCYHELVKYRD
jgi:hypothetical protein